MATARPRARSSGCISLKFAPGRQTSESLGSSLGTWREAVWRGYGGKPTCPREAARPHLSVRGFCTDMPRREPSHFALCTAGRLIYRAGLSAQPSWPHWPRATARPRARSSGCISLKFVLGDKLQRASVLLRELGAKQSGNPRRGCGHRSFLIDPRATTLDSLGILKIQDAKEDDLSSRSRQTASGCQRFLH